MNHMNPATMAGGTAPRRSPLTLVRGLAVAAATALLMAGAAGCSGPKQLTGACGVVVDGSNSGSATSGFDAGQQLHDQLYSFLGTAGCRYVVFAPINGASQQSVCSAPELDMDPSIQGGGNVDFQQLQQEAYAAAMKRAEQVLTCARSDPRSIHNASDVIGGLDRIAQERPAVSGSWSVLAVSDFRNWAPDLRLSQANLTTEASRNALISRLAGEGLLPNFHDAYVYAVGFGLLESRNPASFPDFKDFWQQFMSRAHAQFQPDGS